MARYHVNPETGQAGVCKALYSCRFGDLTKDHYKTPLEAAQAFEKKMEEELVPQALSRTPPPKHLTEIEMASTVADLEEKLAENPSASLYPGRVTGWKNIHELDKITEGASTIVKRLSNPEDGGFERPNGNPNDSWAWSDEAGEMVKVRAKAADVEGFKMVGRGMMRNAYLDEETGLVYKVPNDFLDPKQQKWSKSDEISSGGTIVIEQKAYAQISDEDLSKENVEYLTTVFISVEDGKGNKVPLVVQPYLDPEEYEPHQIDSAVWKRLRQNNRTLSDGHSGNISRNKTTGKIVLFDCLGYTY